MNKHIERMLALVCVVCPVCMARRRWPRARLSRGLAWLERGCPFCRAYAAVHARRTVDAGGSSTETQHG